MTILTKPPPQLSPKPNAAAPPPRPVIQPASFAISGGVTRTTHRVVVYGTGGIGKSTLASLIRKVNLEPIFLDLEGGSQDMDVQRVDPGGPWTFAKLRAALQARELWTPGRVAVIDTMSRAQELATEHIIATTKTPGNDRASSIEDYGYGKGFQYLYEAMLLLLADCDRLHERGINVVTICHDARANVPNPMGEDYIRYEPCLYHSTKGKASVREAVKSWCDHLLFLAYDILVDKRGKASGGGSRRIYTQESPMFLAKSRTLAADYPYDSGNASVWQALFSKEN